MTLKPEGFTMLVRPRHSQAAYSFQAAEPSEQAKHKTERAAVQSIEAHNTPLLVLYGSNMGTAEGIARELAETAKFKGFRSEVAALNERVGKLPKEGIVFIVTASYNGKPPSNARGFMQWLEKVEPGELKGVRYAVFGCGDRNWAGTYQQVPRLIDDQLKEKGAQRLAVRGEADVSGDFEKHIEDWEKLLWSDVFDALGLKSDAFPQEEGSTLSVQFVSGLAGAPLAESYDAFLATVQENRELQDEGSNP